MKYANIFYFKKLNALGGTEQFLYEIAKKYHDYDITIFYDDADAGQLKRLRKFVRCQRRKKGEKIECEKAFFNYNIEIIDDVIADEYVFISHGIYQELNAKPPIENAKLNRFIGVSEYSARMLDEYGKKLNRGIHTEVCYNPLTIEPKKKVIRLISATRLDDRVKGGDRILKLIDAMDRYATAHDRQYVWLIFTNKYICKSPNVAIMKPRTDIRPYIADSDYLVQLSNDMETYCYSINEALSYGVPVITTPLSIMKELPVTDQMQITCEWDMSNADDVARQIFERKARKFTYKAPEDDWINVLALEPSTYDANELIRVRATENYSKKRILDNELGTIPSKDYEWEVDIARYEQLTAFEERTGIKLIERV